MYFFTANQAAAARSNYHAAALVFARICNDQDAANQVVITTMCRDYPCSLCVLRLFPPPNPGLNEHVRAAAEDLVGASYAVTMSRNQLQLRNRCVGNDEFNDTWASFGAAYFQIILPNGHYEYGPDARYSGVSLSHPYVHIAVTLEDDVAEIVVTKNPDCSHDIPFQPPGHVFCYLPFNAETFDEEWAERRRQEELEEMFDDMHV